jgi:hypothetical protein
MLATIRCNHHPDEPLHFTPIEYPQEYDPGLWFFPDQRHGIFALIRPSRDCRGDAVSALAFTRRVPSAGAKESPAYELGSMIPSLVESGYFNRCLSDSFLQALVFDDGESGIDDGGFILIDFDPIRNFSSSCRFEMPLEVHEMIEKDGCNYFMDFRLGFLLLERRESAQGPKPVPQSFVLSYGVCPRFFVCPFEWLVSHNLKCSTSMILVKAHLPSVLA